MTVNPYDIKSVLLARHAQHVVLIHFPVALFPAAVAFDYLAHWIKNRALAGRRHSTIFCSPQSLRCPLLRLVLLRGNGRSRGKGSKGFC